MIGVDDPRWLSTVPHLVRPMADEWLVGLLLRCDLANGWTAGTTGRQLRRSPTSPPISNQALWAFATARSFNLPRLAGLLATPLDALRQTTFEAALMRLRTPSRAGPRRMVVARPFQICPTCIAARRLVARSHVLPLVYSCLEHGLRLEATCRCGALLRPFHRAAPFTCPACALGWWDLPSRVPDDDTLALDGRLMQLFRYFLDHGTAESIVHAMQAVVDERRKRGLKRHLPPLPRAGALPATVWDQATVSLTRVVGAMAALDLPPEAVRPPPQPRVPASQVPCLNRVCPHFGVVSAGNVHPFRWTPNAEIYYCMECGSHFSQTRLVSSFDEGCSPPGASPRRGDVLEERARVAAWRVALEAVCMQMVAEDTPIAVPATFRRAGLPRTPRLRVSRLGLTATVEQYATLQTQGIRGRILDGFRAGMTPGELARTLGVSITLVREVWTRRPKGHHGRGRYIQAEQEGALRAQLEASPTATIAMHAQTWNQTHGTTMHRSTMRTAIHRLGWTRVKGRWEPPNIPTVT